MKRLNPRDGGENEFDSLGLFRFRNSTQMARYAYRIVNVFTQGDTPFTGNPLCVFEDGASLDTAQMQAFALQFNLSETTFILPSQRASAAVRIFTPSYEMPFAGTPTSDTRNAPRAHWGSGGRRPMDLASQCPQLARIRKAARRACPDAWHCRGRDR